MRNRIRSPDVLHLASLTSTCRYTYGPTGSEASIPSGPSGSFIGGQSLRRSISTYSRAWLTVRDIRTCWLWKRTGSNAEQAPTIHVRTSCGLSASRDDPREGEATGHSLSSGLDVGRVYGCQTTSQTLAKLKTPKSSHTCPDRSFTRLWCCFCLIHEAKQSVFASFECRSC